MHEVRAGPTRCEAWGNALMKQGKPREALTIYDEALYESPNWKTLKEARNSAAGRPATVM